MISRHGLGWLLSLIGVLMLGAGLGRSVVLAQEESSGMSSLDEQLFNDLGDDLFGDLELPPEIEVPPQEQGQSLPAGAEEEGQVRSDDERTGPRGFGADLPTDSEQGDPLTRIGSLMRQVQQQMAAGQAEKRTVAMQQQIVEEIEKLLQQDQQQNQNQNNSQNQQQNRQQNQQNQQNQQQGQSGQPSQQQEQSGNQQQEPGKEQPQGGEQAQQQQSGGTQSQPGEEMQQEGEQDQEGETDDSSDRLRNDPVVAISPEEQDALIKEAWGNLPSHLRKQISNTSMERFLPKYEKLTQEYFRRLAERKE